MLTGATLKLSGAPKASANDTVVIRLCVESKRELPVQRREALIEHLLIQPSAVGLQIEPHEKIPAATAPNPRWDFDLERTAQLNIQFQTA